MSATRTGCWSLVLLVLVWSGQVAAGDVPLAAEDQFDESFIGFDDFGSVVTDHHGNVTGTYQWSVPYEGRYKKPLAGADFYRKLGRADLVQEYEDRQSLKTGLLVGGGAVWLATIVATVAIASSQIQSQDCGPVTSPSFGACVQRSVATHQGFDATTSLVFLGGAMLGGGLLWAGAAIDPNPVDSVGARQLADEYNRDLRQRLFPQPPPPDPIEVSVVPHLERDGGGVTLAFRF